MAMSSLYFTLSMDYAARQIDVHGEFDVATAACLASAVAGFQRSAGGDITIEIRDVTFIDAAGLGAVVAARKAQRDIGSRLTVNGATTPVRRMFDLSDLSELLEP